MRCPNCSHDNIAGVDFCEECGTDLAGLDLPEARTGFRGRLLTDHIADLPTAPPVVVSPKSTVTEAIEKMRSEQHGCVLVQEGSELVGIFTEKDVLTRVLRPAIDPAATPVSAVMTPKPMIVAPTDPPAFAIHNRVARDLRHMPVVEDSKIVGFLSERHILSYIQEDILGAG
ncbi:MAG: CBS domain-containing protein [Acidobacteria bacterium]|nr:MAG: CBS domain-containing protein [Acidobacteriota bacterium]